jgi:hypothetical protein
MLDRRFYAITEQGRMRLPGHIDSEDAAIKYVKTNSYYVSRDRVEIVAEVRTSIWER